MKTITAKDLRDNLDQIVKRARAGESIRVTHRSKVAFTIQPEIPADTLVPGSPAAMKEFVRLVREMNKIPRQSQLDPNKSIKELYHEMLDNDPKYKPPYHR